MTELLEGSLPQEPTQSKLPNRKHIATIAGHSPPQLGLSYTGDGPIDAHYKEQIRGFIYNYQIDILYTGLNLGIDQLGAEAALDMGIRVEGFIPNEPMQHKNWEPECLERYKTIMNGMDFLHIVHSYNVGVSDWDNRDRQMIQSSQYLLTYWDGSPGRTKNMVLLANSTEHIEIVFCIIPHGQPVLECDAERS